MRDKLLDIKNLTVNYETDDETVHAVNNITLSLEKGETIGLVGETGAGKTTTALSIMQLLPERTGKIKDGNIYFEGKDMFKLSEEELMEIRGDKIAMIFQDPMTSLNPVLTVGEQIAEAIFLHRNISDEAIEIRVDELLDLVGIPSTRKNEYPHQFSGGMKQRVVIAMALACDPDLLIADEPTTALDVTIQAQVLNMMIKLKEKFNTAMIMITHDLGVVAKICDKVAIMYAGEIIEYGTIYDIYKNKNHHPYTKGLFEAIPNLILDTTRLKAIGGMMPDPTDLPSGCKFHPRCENCMEKCKNIEPEYVVNKEHLIKCHLFNEDNNGN